MVSYTTLPGWRVGSWDELDENGFYKNSVNAAEDQLKFAEACCEIAQMDLSEFFEAWGFFIPMKNAFVGDYGHKPHVLTKEMYDEFKADMDALVLSGELKEMPEGMVEEISNMRDLNTPSNKWFPTPKIPN